MMSFANEVGRLVEVRAKWPPKIEDALRFVSIVEAVSAANPPGALVLVDSRNGGVLPQAIFQAFVDNIASQPHAPARAAIIMSESAIVALQMNRMQKEIHRSEMRAFRDPAEAVAWLGEVASDAERARMRAFLATAAPPGSLRASA